MNTPVVASDVWLLPLAVGWDLLLGEPLDRLHPVVWIGNVARAIERRAPQEGVARPLAYGALLAFGPPLAYATLVAVSGRWLRHRPGVALALGVPLLKSTFAIGELRRAGARVQAALATGDLAAARVGLGWLVSRDASALGAPLIAAAAIESLAENLSDAIVAPLCYWALFGLPGAVAYRAINTLDAMVGYHGRYEWLGKGAARLDDAANVAPARLTALLLLGAAALLGEDAPRALATLRRDARETESPNAAWPMAAIAGALGVELEKVGHYRLGAGGAAPDAATIARADRLVRAVAGGTVVLACGVRLLIRARRGAG
jgi:adenosylcobinamide-phosphate synthase